MADQMNNTDTAALLPCPFCGSHDVFVERADFASCFIQCNECSVRGPIGCQESDDEEMPGKAEAIAAWNRRASPAVEAPAQPPNVTLPERVIDTLLKAAELSTYHPDGDQLEKLHAFAHGVTAEVLARLPASTVAAQPVDDGFAEVAGSILGQIARKLESAKQQVAAPEVPEKPTMFCPQCGADRFKEDCKGNRQNCQVKGVAQ